MVKIYLWVINFNSKTIDIVSMLFWFVEMAVA